MEIPVRAWNSRTRSHIALLRHVSFFATITAAAKLYLFFNNRKCNKKPIGITRCTYMHVHMGSNDQGDDCLFHYIFFDIFS